MGSCCGCFEAILGGMKLPRNGVRAYLKRRRPRSKPLLVCMGDSLTHGWCSANYTLQLAERTGGASSLFDIVNAGMNGDMVYHLLQRVDEVIALSPDCLLLMIGTNDIMGGLNPDFTDEAYVKVPSALRKLPENWRELPDRVPSVPNFISNLRALLIKCLKETSAKIAIASPPPMGEAFGDDAPFAVNNQLAEMANTIRTVVDSVNSTCAQPRVVYLPLFEQQQEALAKAAPATSGNCPPKAFDLLSKFGGTLQDPDMLFTKILMSNTWAHYVQKKTWDELAAAKGLRLTHDTVHLTEYGATFLVALVDDWLASQSQGGMVAQ